MTEEEKKAIELIGLLNLNESYIITSKQSNEQDVHKAIDIILNLIEKLQKENEELKKGSDINVGSIPKDKIRKKIKELENGEQCYYEFSTVDLVDLLKILLEEE